MDGNYIREHFFGRYPELLKLVANYSDEKLEKMRRGGHDPEKVYAAYKMATELNNGRPTVILAKTIKGYGLGEEGEGRNVAHNLKKQNEQELLQFRDRFGIPISDEDVKNAPFYTPPENSREMQYLHQRREALGGYVPSRPTTPPTMQMPRLSDYQKTLDKKLTGDRLSTTMAVVRLLGDMLRDKEVGSTSCPSFPTSRARSVWKVSSSKSEFTLTPANSTNLSGATTRSLPTTKKRKMARFLRKGSLRLDQWRHSTPPERPTASTGST